MLHLWINSVPSCTPYLQASIVKFYISGFSDKSIYYARVAPLEKVPGKLWLLMFCHISKPSRVSILLDQWMMIFKLTKNIFWSVRGSISDQLRLDHGFIFGLAGTFLTFWFGIDPIIPLCLLSSKKSDLSYFTSLSYAPSVVIWTGLVLTKKAKLHWLSYTWGLCTIGLVVSNVTGLVVSTIIVFATVVDNMGKESLLGLKVTLCITPILLLLLLNTATDVKDLEDLLPALFFEMAVDLVDKIEILDIVLDEKEHNYGIPNAFGHAMVAIACIRFLLSPWKMLGNDFETGKELPMRALLALVNFVFLIIRSVILIKYKKDESIFILKNLVAIILRIMGIRQLRRDNEISDICC